MLHLYFFYLFALLLIAKGQFTLPILSDKAYHLLSGDILVGQQLRSWGIGLDVELGLGTGLGLQIRDGNEKGKGEGKGEGRRSRTRGLGLGTNLGTGLLSNVNSGVGLNVGAGGGIASPVLGEVGKVLGWGEADSVAKGERGDTEWYTYITLGAPPQSIPVLPDTGSSDLWVFGPACPTCGLSNHTAYSPSKSSSFTNESKSWAFGYADGTIARGYAAGDLAGIAGGSGVSTKIDFGVATKVAGSSFALSARSGIFGLGLDGMASIPSDLSYGGTFFSRLVKGKQIDEMVLSIRLSKGEQSQGVVSQEGEGRYTFGGIEDGYVVGGRAGLSWVGVTSANYWGFPLDDISMGYQSVLIGDTVTPHRAIIDSGTTLIITSDQAALSIHSHIPNSFRNDKQIWYIPCNAAYPEVQNVFFTIGARRFGVPVADLAWKKSDDHPGFCVSGVQGGMPSFTVLGDMFIKNHYVVLSYGSDKEDSVQVGLGDRTDIPWIL